MSIISIFFVGEDNKTKTKLYAFGGITNNLAGNVGKPDKATSLKLVFLKNPQTKQYLLT